MMSQQRILQLSLVGAILLCLLVGVYLFAGRRFSKSDSSATVISHPVDTPPADVLKYWTKDKMRKAKAAKLPTTNALERGEQHSQRPPHSSDPHNS